MDEPRTESGELDGRVPSGEIFCSLIQSRTWSTQEPKPTLFERMLAISVELQRLPKKGQMSLGGRGSFPYHNIDDVMTFFAHAQLKYRVFIKTSHSGHEFTPASKPYIIMTFSVYNVDDPTEFDNWTWVDDGEDFTKAAAFTLKYGLLRHFLSSDGKDEELVETNIQSRSASVQNKPRANNTPSPAVRQVNINDPSSQAKLEILNGFNEQLKTPYGENYVASMFGLYDTRANAKQLTQSMIEAGSPFNWIYQELKKQHLENAQCGSRCEHFQSIFDRLKAVK